MFNRPAIVLNSLQQAIQLEMEEHRDKHENLQPQTDSEDVSRAADLLEREVFTHPSLHPMLDAMLEMVLVLNDQRRVVYANRAFVDSIGADGKEELLGRRVGELLDCVHALESPEGCGGAEACITCGANLANLKALRGRSDRRECRILRCRDFDALDLLVNVTPIQVEGRNMLFCAFTDISEQKRRQALERTFFHDVLNTAGVVAGYTRLMTAVDAEKARPFAAKSYAATETLIDEIKAQRELCSAERGELEVHPTEIDSLELLRTLSEAWAQHEVARNRSIDIDLDHSESVIFTSDLVLLRRVLANMIKNALEATPEDGVVTLTCLRVGGTVEFTVHNPTSMPRTVALQIFKRSFSTKGKGHGLGTYSMKMISERYLSGKVTFNSSTGNGTVFRARYPVAWSVLDEHLEPLAKRSNTSA